MRRTAPQSGGTRASHPGSGAPGSWCTGQRISVAPPGPRQRLRMAGKTQHRLLLPHLGCCSCLHSPRSAGSGSAHGRQLQALAQPLTGKTRCSYVAYLHWPVLSALSRQLSSAASAKEEGVGRDTRVIGICTCSRSRVFHSIQCKIFNISDCTARVQACAYHNGERRARQSRPRNVDPFARHLPQAGKTGRALLR